jgi:VWFA-related protein
MIPSMTRALFFFSLLLLASGLRADNPMPPASDPAHAATPTFPSQIEIVTVDAVVVDGKGNPVTGLRREDFLLSQDGVVQPIESFEPVELPSLPETGATPRHPPVAANTRAELRSGRVFAIVFDDMHLSQLQAYRAKQAIAQFLDKGVREGDRVVLMATSGQASWTARMRADRDELLAVMKRLDGRRMLETSNLDRMTDYEAMRIVQYRDTSVGQRVMRRFDDAGVLNQPGLSGQDKYDTSGAQRYGSNVSHPYVELRAQEVYDLALTRTKITLQSIERLLEGLGAVKGRKSLILVSEGFILDPTVRDSREVVRAARKANVAIYFLDTRGLEGTSSLYGAELGVAPVAQDIGPLLADLSFEAQGSEELASATGGFTVKNTNDLAGGIVRISNELRAYYLLGYHPPQSLEDGRFHKIEVRVNRKNVEVRARRGYYAPEPGKPAARPDKDETLDPDLRRAVDAPFELDGVPLRMTAYALGETLVGTSKVVVAAEVDLRNMAFEKQEDRLVDAVDLLLFVTHRETGEVVQYPETLAMRLKPETLERTPWYPLVREFDLGPGAYQAKLVVRDQKGGKLGSVFHSFTVPDRTGFSAATPVLSKKLGADAQDPQAFRPVIQVSRSFPVGGRLYCQIEVFNAQKDVETGKAQVTQGFTLRTSDGSIVLEAAPTPISPSPKGGLTRLMGIPLDGLRPGEYEIEIHLKDQMAGKTLELREPLSLVAADSAP